MADTMTLIEVHDLLGMALAHGGSHISIHRTPARNAYDAIDAAIKQREQDKRDAARYRWLAKHENGDLYMENPGKELLDRAIDAAMAKESGNG